MGLGTVGLPVTAARLFPRPCDRVIAVKVINHFGDEVMKVYRV